MKRFLTYIICAMLTSFMYAQVKYNFEKVHKAAMQGDADAQARLSYLYLTRHDSIDGEDLIEAHKWAEKAANQGHAMGAYILGEVLTIVNDFTEAYKYYLMAAEKGVLDACYEVGSSFYMGRGVKKDLTESFRWYLKAAEGGFVGAQVQIGFMYSRGEGTEKNLDESFRWTKMAAEKGDAVAQANLSWDYFKGNGTNIDLEEGYKWAMKSAEQGQELGYENLANFYLVGSRRNIPKAIECLDKAIELCKSSGRAEYDNTYLLRLYSQKGVIYLDDKNYAKAKEMAQLIMDINPQYEDEEDNRLMVYMQTGEVIDDRQNLAQVKRIKPSSDVDMNIPQGLVQNENTFAVIIANENYEEEKQVEFVLNDGEIFKTYCQDVLGLPETNIHYRADATLNNILAELDWMKQISIAFGNEAKFIFYYAGHGIPDEATGDSYLLPVDGRGNMLATGYSLKKLYDTLGGLVAKSVTVFMDACFSGAVRSGGMMASARGVAIKAKQTAPKGNMIVFSAAQGDETAYPYKEKRHGLFTYHLLKKLQETKGDVTMGELSDYISSEVKKRSIIVNGKLQTPVVISSNSAIDWRNWKLK